MKQLKKLAPGILTTLILLTGCSDQKPEVTDETFLQEHVVWLADDERNGRLAGTIHEAEAANYLADHFLQYGLEPAGDEGTYIQQFTLEGPVVQAMELENQISRNVVGRVEGQAFPNRYIIIGAHYDGQGTGGVISMNHNTDELIHNSADDNASGTAGILYLTKKFVRQPSRHSILFIAFSGEELGLIGSKHFADQMEISPDSVMAMINLDMIGRLSDNELSIIGTGTSNVWEEILNSIDTDSLYITTSPGGMGSSDHASFYEKEIPVLHYFTGTHNQYHRETDTADLVNYHGISRVLNHVEQTIREVDSLDIAEIEFRESTDPQRSRMRRDGVTLGVIPDYTFSEYGFRVEQVQPEGPAARADMQEGDIIIQMGDTEVEDIYGYMDALSSFESGDTVKVQIIRNDEEMELTVTF